MKYLKASEEFTRLLHIVEELRQKCPWDKKQNFESLRTLTLEEVYELNDALLQKNFQDIKEESGDVLLHIVFYALLGAEENAFNMATILHDLNEKLIYRHPHIYGNTSAETEDEVKSNWEKLKLEKKKNHKSTGILSGVTASIPSLLKAYRMQEKLAAVSFDFPSEKEALEKFKEEEQEFLTAETDEDKKVEFGDMLFSLINYGRKLGINADEALELSNKKFKNRVSNMEKLCDQKGLDFTNLEPEQLDNLWNQAKKMD